MKSIYIKKIILGILALGIVFIIDSSLFKDLGMLLACLVLFLLPVIILSGKRLNIWIISYILLGASIFYTTIIPPTLKMPDGSCSGIYCGMDDRPLIFIFLYFCALVTLAIWQLISFIQKRNSKGLTQN